MPRSKLLAGIPLILTLLLSAPPSVRANDTLATLGAGGLVPLKSSTIVMESEKLHITLHRVTVDYVFHNITSQDVDAIVAFPLPELDGAALEVSPIELPSKDPTNFMSFKLTVGGAAVSPKVEIRAFKKEEQITEQLKSFGLPVSVLDPHMKAAIAKLPKPQSIGSSTKDLRRISKPGNGFGPGGKPASNFIGPSISRPTAPSASHTRTFPSWEAATSTMTEPTSRNAIAALPHSSPSHSSRPKWRNGKNPACRSGGAVYSTY